MIDGRKNSLLMYMVVMNKGEKSSQATYTLMDSYLTAANPQKELWDTIDSSLNMLAQQWSER